MGKTTQETSIRPARPEDYRLFTALKPELGLPDDPTPDAPKFERDVMPLMQIAERGGTPVGYVFARPLADVMHVVHVITARTSRRTGVGRSLMEAARRAARAAGSKTLALGVMPSNAGAIALYEQCGLSVVYPSKALRIAWSVIDALPEASTPHVSEAREVSPVDDASLEDETQLLRGILAQRRGQAGWVLRRIGPRSIAAFDPSFPGANPFRAPDLPHALSLVRALRPFARAGDTALSLLIDRDMTLANGLVELGAEVRLDVLHMRGPVE